MAVQNLIVVLFDSSKTVAIQQGGGDNSISDFPAQMASKYNETAVKYIGVHDYANYPQDEEGWPEWLKIGSQEFQKTTDHIGGETYLVYESIGAPVSYPGLCLVEVGSSKFSVNWTDTEGAGVVGSPATGTLYDEGENVTVQFTAPSGFLLRSVLADSQESLTGSCSSFSETFEIHSDVNYVIECVPASANGQLMLEYVGFGQVGCEGTYVYDHNGTFEYTSTGRTGLVRKVQLRSVNGRNFPAGEYLCKPVGVGAYGVTASLGTPSSSIVFVPPLPWPTLPLVENGWEIILSSFVDGDSGDVEEEYDPGFRTDPSKPVPGAGATDDGRYVGECVLYLADVLNNRFKDAIDEISQIEEDLAGIDNSLEEVVDVLGGIRDLLPIEVAVDAQGVQYPGSDEVDDYLERRNNV